MIERRGDRRGAMTTSRPRNDVKITGRCGEVIRDNSVGDERWSYTVHAHAVRVELKQ